jgi:hypothetical protein
LLVASLSSITMAAASKGGNDAFVAR